MPAPSARRGAIPYVHWQHKPGRNASALGEIVVALDDLEEAIHTCVLTQKGTVPLQPEKCCDLLSWIDRPEAVAIPNLTREIWDGITTWEPRVLVESTKPRRVADGHWRFPVFFRPRADVSRLRMTEVPFAAP